MLSATASARMSDGTVLNVIVPALPAQAYKSYALRRPLRTHWRKASCEEVNCPDWQHGWVTTVDTSDELGKRRFDFITHDRTRRHSMQHVGPDLFKFVFGPGFTCYRAHEHRTRVDRPPLLLVTGGDWRGNPRRTPAYVHRTPENWVDDFATHQERLARAQR